MHFNLLDTLFLATACPAITSTPFNASFDDLASNPPFVRRQPRANSVRRFGLPNFDVRANGVSILRAHSPNNAVTHLPSPEVVLNPIIAMITSKYAGSDVKYFDLDSTYLGCAVQTDVSLGVAEPCTVQFSGTTTNGKVVTEDCVYKGSALNPALVQCNFSNLKSVQSVNVIVIQAATLNLTAEFLDNVVGVLYS